MEYNSLVLAELLGVLDSPSPDAVTGRPTIPPVLQPVFTPGGPTRTTVSAGGVRHDSHFCDDLRQQAGASGGTTGILTTLKKGVWRITGSYQFVSSLMTTPTANTLRMTQGGTGIGFLAAFIGHTTALVQGLHDIDVQLTLSADTVIDNNIGATIAGERVAVDVVLHCQRIA